MRVPAALPAFAIAAGSFAALFLAFNPPRSLLIGVWLAAAAAHFTRRDVAATSLLMCGFACAGGALAHNADQAATHTVLGELVQQHLDEGEYQLFARVEGRLRADAARSESGVTLSVMIDRVGIGGKDHVTSGGALIGVGGELATDQILQWRSGRRVAFPATLRAPTRYLNPGASDTVRALAWRGTTLVGSVKSDRLVEVIGRGDMWSELLAAARSHVRQTMAASVGVWSERSAAVAIAILIGDRAGLDGDLERRLQKAGTYHVIAISGGNIAIFAALCLAVLRLLSVGWRSSSLITAVVLITYALGVEGGSSVARATLMAVLYLCVRFCDHSSRPLNIAALTAAALFCVLPLQVVDPGFALTFGATCGILAGMPLLDRYLPQHGWRRACAALVGATLCAEIALMPIGAYVFSRVTFAGLLVNVAAIPAMTIVQIAGMLSVGIASSGADSAARAVGWIVHAGVEVLIQSAVVVDYIPSLTWRLAPPLLGVMVLYYGAISLALVLPAPVRGTGPVGNASGIRAACALCAAACACWILASPVVSRPWEAGRLRVTFPDVGQGDAAIVRFPNGRALSIDTGGSPGSRYDIGARVVSPALWAAGVRRLHYLSVTHGDADHIGGAASVFEDFEPGEVWEGVPVPPHAPTRVLRQVADDRGSAWRTLQSGDRVQFGEVELRVHHPPPPDWERQRVRNDDSQVMELRHGGVSIVLSGDIGREVEGVIAGGFEPVPVRILKVPHHGSATSSSQTFLDALEPDIAVISAGRGNPFGHPARAVLERYVRAGAAIYRTDRDGAVTVETDGTRVQVRTFTGRRLTLTTFGR